MLQFIQRINSLAFLEKSRKEDVYGTGYCSQECAHKDRRTVKRPSKEKLVKMIEETSYVAVGKKFGVSDNAIRKWLKNY